MSEIKKMYIRGEWVEAESGETLEVFNPATGECVGVVSYGDERDAKKAIDAAHEAFRDWSRLPGRQRSKYLTKLYELVMKHRNELAELMSAEMGKPFGEAKFEAVGSADNFLWYAEEAKRIYGETIPSYDGSKRLMAIKQPVGVVGRHHSLELPGQHGGEKNCPGTCRRVYRRFKTRDGKPVERGPAV